MRKKPARMKGVAAHRRRAPWLAPALVAITTVIAFLPVLKAGFVSWDDDKNFLENLAWRGLGVDQLRWMWTTFHLGHYVPLSWMTLGLDYEIWGMDPAGYHATNLTLHAANAVLVFFIARRILVAAGAAQPDARALDLGAAFAALAFAVHPLRVESVAWITERRDVLSGLFCFASLLTYLRWRDDPASPRRYWTSLALFVAALLSKATAVTLPAVLLILEWYPLRGVGGAAGWTGDAARRTWRALLPFWLLAAASGALAIVAVGAGELQLDTIGKVAASAYSLAFYAWKTVVPLRLAPLYPMPTSLDAFAARYVVSLVAVVALSTAAWFARRRAPGAAFAWLAFVAVVFPLLGVHQNGPQIAADRYTYDASVALAVLAGAAFIAAHRRVGVGALAAGCAVVVALGALTWRQSGFWRDSESLWSRAVEISPESHLAQNDLGNVYIRQARVAEALPRYEAAVRLKPDYLDAGVNLGVALARSGRNEEAKAQFRRVIALHPEAAEPHNNLGVVLASEGNAAEAMAEYRAAVAAMPAYPDAHVNLGNALSRAGRYADAIEEYRAALAIQPDRADARAYLDRLTAALKKP